MSQNEAATGTAQVIDRKDGRSGGDGWNDNFEGKPYGAGISVILESTETVGSGPRLHRHPYPETFIIRRGQALFTVGGQEIVGRAGQILVVPAGVPHKFSVLGPDYFESVNIHANDELVTEWLEPAAR
jgi:quercetin dioxygenase-like cupin family protein